MAAFGLTPRQLVVLAILEGVTQGVLLPLLVNFLASKRGHHPWFKLYVVFVNALSLVHTILRIVEAFSAMDATQRLLPLELGSIFLTCSVAAFTQAFYIYRCWRIFNRRTLFIVPYLVGLATALASGASIVATIWIFSAFTLDLSLTLTMVIYLYRLRADHGDQDNVFLTVWHVVWASASPPLALMAMVIFDVYILPGTLVPSLLVAALTEKFLLISLMIALMGQGYVRRQLDRPRRTVPTSLALSQGPLELASRPVFAPGVSSIVNGHTPSMKNSRVMSGYDSEATGRDLYAEDVNKSRLSVTKPPAAEPCRSIQIHLTQTS
ncbi:unnamed protein product [Rhizoctonia solani]|uniref:Uncharacterized protein n=1 Tax=Rhizoctonia solani TaxID=456999 RepID=A0A8H3HWF0_9AGAM|nr:unnamed protein product [Rhizoctonia solani]